MPTHLSRKCQVMMNRTVSQYRRLRLVAQAIILIKDHGPVTLFNMTVKVTLDHETKVLSEIFILSPVRPMAIPSSSQPSKETPAVETLTQRVEIIDTSWRIHTFQRPKRET